MNSLMIKGALKMIGGTEMIKNGITTMIPQLLDYLKQKEAETPLEEGEMQHAIILVREEENIFAVHCTLDDQNNVKRKLTAMNLVEYVKNLDIDKLLSKL